MKFLHDTDLAAEIFSDVAGIPETFMVNLHPHTWQDEKYKGADGSGISANKEGGQTVIVQGIKQ